MKSTYQKKVMMLLFLYFAITVEAVWNHHCRIDSCEERRWLKKKLVECPLGYENTNCLANREGKNGLVKNRMCNLIESPNAKCKSKQFKFESDDKTRYPYVCIKCASYVEQKWTCPAGDMCMSTQSEKINKYVQALITTRPRRAKMLTEIYSLNEITNQAITYDCVRECMAGDKLEAVVEKAKSLQNNSQQEEEEDLSTRNPLNEADRISEMLGEPQKSQKNAVFRIKNEDVYFVKKTEIEIMIEDEEEIETLELDEEQMEGIREIEILKTLQGCNYFPKIYGSKVENKLEQKSGQLIFKKSVYLVTEYLQGRTLKDLFDHDGWCHLDSRVRETALKGLVDQLLAGLKMMHSKNIMHRDIKPENIMIAEDGQLRIVDMGSCINCNEGPFLLTGSPGFMDAPLGEEKSVSEDGTKKWCYDQSVDLWSVGMLIYYGMTGRNPLVDNVREGDATAWMGDKRVQVLKLNDDDSLNVMDLPEASSESNKGKPKIYKRVPKKSVSHGQQRPQYWKEWMPKEIQDLEGSESMKTLLRNLICKRADRWSLNEVLTSEWMIEAPKTVPYTPMVDMCSYKLIGWKSNDNFPDIENQDVSDEETRRRLALADPHFLPEMNELLAV